VPDVADYCRQVEAHLTRINGGHLVRVVGAGFVLVKQWADDDVPLSIVFRGIEQKAERHRAGTSVRPLRIEFCESDVRELHAVWKRAVGLTATVDAEPAAPGTGPKRRSLPQAIDRAITRLGRLAGRLDYPEGFRDSVSHAIEELSALREALAHTRGAARAPLLERLIPLERDLLEQARRVITAEQLADLAAQAEQELAPYRDRLSSEAWERAVSVTVDRGVREHLALPSLEFS
jgi:hypothetical protein